MPEKVLVPPQVLRALLEYLATLPRPPARRDTFLVPPRVLYLIEAGLDPEQILSLLDACARRSRRTRGRQHRGRRQRLVARTRRP